MTDFTPDSDSPTLPYAPPEVRAKWTEDEKFARHCQEISAANEIWIAREQAGQSAAVAAIGLPVPYMNRKAYHKDANGEWISNISPYTSAEEARRAITEIEAAHRPRNARRGRTNHDR